MDIVLVAAVADNGVIGRNNDIPWRLKSDLQRFRKITTGKPVVMGRKTFESLGRPLPGRTNIVVSRDAAFTAPGIVVVNSIEHALEAARGDALRRGAAEIVIGGGSHIYAACLPFATKLELTRVHARPDGDTQFPPLDLGEWEEVAKVAPPQSPDDSVAFTWLTYRRLQAPRVC